MAGKASPIVILAKLKKKNGRHFTCLMSNGVILLKRPYISPNIAPIGSECENNLWEVMAWDSFPGVEFDL